MKLSSFSIAFIFLVIQIVQGHTTWDGKNVPSLPDPENPVICSTLVQLYLAVRTQCTGRTIVLKNGVYDIANIEPLNIDSPYITIRGITDDPNGVVLVANGFNSCVNVEEEMIVLYTHHTTFANLTLSESRCHGIKFQHNNNDNMVAHNVRFLNIGERAVKGPGETMDASQCTVRYCHFENTKIPPAIRCGHNYLDSSGDYIAGMDIMGADSWVVHDCVFRNIRGATGDGRGGIFFWGGNAGNANTNMIVERSTFVGCDRAICYGNPWGTNCVNGGYIRNNFIVRGADKGIEMENCTDIRIYNNTLYSSDPNYARAVYFNNNFSGNEFRNNIVFGNISGSVNTMSSNITRNSSGDAATNWFVNRTNGDLHLTANATAAINQGAAGLVTGDFDGHQRIDGQCDIGADEYNSTIGITAVPSPLSSSVFITAAPNPFNSVVTISCRGGHGQIVHAMVYNIRGQCIVDLTRCINKVRVTWNAAGLASDVYTLWVKIGDTVYKKRLFLVK